MQIGDPKKALILAIVALIILSVAAFQLIPRGAKPILATALRAPGTGGGQSQPLVGGALPSIVTSDPFSFHKTGDAAPKLATSQSERKPDNTNPSTTQSVTNGPSAASHIPYPLGIAPFELTPDKGGKALPPVEITSIGQQLKKEEHKKLTLEAVVKVDQQTAMMNIDGKQDLRCQIGSKVGEYTVFEISDSGVILKKGTKRLQIAVGASVDL